MADQDKLLSNYILNKAYDENTDLLNVSNISTTKSDLFLSIAQGNINGVSSVFKFGHNEDIGTSEEVLWDAGGNYIFLDSGETMDIYSDDADDIYGGAGAWNLIVYGLDEDWNEISEYVALSGTTVVTTSAQFMRVYRAHIIHSGDGAPVGDANLGVIKIEGTTTSTLQAQIGIGNGQTLMCVYTVPAGKTAYITGIGWGVGQGKECTFKGKFRNGVGGAFSVKYSQTLYQTSSISDLKTPLKIPEKIDMVITAQTPVGTVHADGSFGLILIDNV